MRVAVAVRDTRVANLDSREAVGAQTVSRRLTSVFVTQARRRSAGSVTMTLRLAYLMLGRVLSLEVPETEGTTSMRRRSALAAEGPG